MAKTPEDLRKSRKIREDFIAEYGYIPTSILVYDKSKKNADIIVDGGRTYDNARTMKTANKAKEKAFNASSCTCRGKKGGLSRFFQNICVLMVKFYCPAKGVVFDPFAGHNSRMQSVFSTGRSYIGVDVSEQFMDANFKIKDYLLQEKEASLISDVYGDYIKLYNHSSAEVPEVEDDFADFTITSPPYWDLEYYGDEPEQLGKNKTYQGFLDSLEDIVRENFRILKKGAFCCYFINDFRKDGIFYSYHSDLINVFNKVGFTHHTNYIVDLGSCIGQAFVQDIINLKLFPKKHEYCIVFQKQ